ncbi:short-chain dehydrogenase/reductase-like protein [Whalleya microplaca]|nr:short-chain dehydrogenase/reductase-like protein [Whalleya microplaca]
MADSSVRPKDYYIKNSQFTENTHLDAYPAIDPRKPDHNLDGKVAIITGASRGIGKRAMVPAFVAAGVKGIVLLATDAEKLAITEQEIKNDNPNIETLPLALDMSDEKAVEAGFERVRNKFGHAHVFINCAGAHLGDGPKLHETDIDLWWRNFEVNAKGLYLLIRAFLRLLPSPDTRATILNLSSWQAFFLAPPMGAYFMTKFVVDSLTTYVAIEYPNVTAVSMHPGVLDTDMCREPFLSQTDNNSFKLVGGMAVWICQDKARFLSGRWISASWDVDDLVKKQDEISKHDLLKLTLRGNFGPTRLSRESEL